MFINYIDDTVKKRAEEVKLVLTKDNISLGCSISNRKKWSEYSKHLNSENLLETIEGYIQQTYAKISRYLVSDSHSDAPVNLLATMRIIEQMTLAECLDDKRRFLPYIIDYSNYMCSVNTWVAKGHYNAFGLSGDEEENNLVDLCSASFAWRFAVCDCILGNKLDKAARDRIKGYIENKVLKVYKKAVAGERGSIDADGRPPLFWLENDNNWLCVCLSGVTAVMLWYCEDPNEKALYIALYEKMIQPFLNAFRDGYSHEGLSYWGYGFSKFINCSEIIGIYTNYKIDLFNHPKSIDTALYGFRSELSKGDFPTASDSGFGEKPLNSNMIYASRRLNIPYECGDFYDFRDDIHSLMLLLRWDEVRRPIIECSFKLDKIRTYFKEAGVLISRNKEMTIFIKGGNNIEPHNHNDLGSFIVSVNGEQLLVDVGYTEYLDKTFSKERYTSNALNSYGHSVPLVMKKMQMPEIFECDKIYEKVIYQAKVTAEKFSEVSDSIEYDLTEVYDYPEVIEVKRKMEFLREKSQIEITHTYSYTEEGDFENAVLTFSKVEVHNNNTLKIIGKENSIFVKCPQDVIVTVDAINGVVTDNHTKHLEPIRIGFKLRKPSKEGQLQILIRPADMNALLGGN